MMSYPDEHTEWLRTLLVYLGVSFAIHLIWESLQLPFYTLWATGSIWQKTFAVLHCTLGDVMIAAASILIPLLLFGHHHWPKTRVARVFIASILLGVGYTVFSEWLNVSVRRSWAYSELMPTVPITDTGVTPLLQWLIVPTLSQWISLGRLPWKDLQSRP